MTSLERPRGWLSAPNACTLFVGLLLLAVYVRPFADLDLLWQIRTGDQIVRSGSPHVTDQFSYTIAGKQLPDSEWLYEIVLWLTWSAGGFAALHLLKVVCVLSPLALVAWRLRRENVGWHAVWLSLAIGILALVPMWNLRPLYLTTVGLLLLSGLLRDHCTGRRPLSWETPLLMLVWGNVHPGVITGQGLLAGAVAWEWLNRWLKLNPPLSREACRRLTFFGGLGLLATLIGPGPIERLHYTFDPNLRHPIMRGFVEIMPLHWYALRPPHFAALIYLVAGAVLLAVVKQFRSFRLWELALLAGVAFLGSYAYRSSQDFLLVMLAVGVPRLTDLYRRAAPKGVPSVLWRIERSAKRVFSSPAFRFQPGWALALLALLSLAGLLPRSHGKDWPEAALDFIEREDIRGHFFSDPNFGAYIVWRRGPDNARCYADTRGFFFPAELLVDTYRIAHLEDDWHSRLSRVLARETDWFLLETRGPGGALWRAMEQTVKPRYRDAGVALVSATEVRRWLANVPE